MKNFLKYWYICIFVLITVVCINYSLFFESNSQDTRPIHLTGEAVKHLEEKKEQDVKIIKEATAHLYTESSDDVSFVNLDEKNQILMGYEEDWCNARTQLSESDYSFARTELADWDELIGKARTGKARFSAEAESWFPNNHFVESYESLPLDQLRELAMQENKWAMVAFIQNRQANDELKDKVAMKLLIRGASYYAIEHLVIRALAAARISINIHNDMDAGAEHIINALVYTYWGLEHYSDSGLGSFNGITANEPFKTKLPIESVLMNSEELINSKLETFINKIEQQRSSLGVNMPTPPQAVKKMFAQNIAARQVLAEQQFELLRNLDITYNSRINITPCVAWHMTNIKGKMSK